MKNIWIIIVVSGVLFSFDLSKSAVKKVDKTIAALWPEQTITKEVINLPEKQQNETSNMAKNNNLYRLLNKSLPVGYLVLSKGRGKMNYFDYMIVFKPDLSILKIKVLVYREEYGGEIGSKRWLKQFVGKSDPQKMKFGHDIQNISGATISARSITEDVKKVTRQIIELKTKEII